MPTCCAIRRHWQSATNVAPEILFFRTRRHTTSRDHIYRYVTGALHANEILVIILCPRGRHKYVRRSNVNVSYLAKFGDNSPITAWQMLKDTAKCQTSCSANITATSNILSFYIFFVSSWSASVVSCFVQLWYDYDMISGNVRKVKVILDLYPEAEQHQNLITSRGSCPQPPYCFLIMSPQEAG